MMEEKPDILPIMEREGVILHKAGRTYRGKCPMHSGKSNGSLTVYPNSQSWYCWGCGEGGDAIDFVKKLHGFSFKDACVHLGIEPGRPVPVDPSIQRRRLLQRAYEKTVKTIYDGLCDRAIHLHKLRLQVKKNPGGLTPVGAVLFAQQMGELAQTEHDLDLMLYGSTEDQIAVIRGAQGNDSANTISRAA